MNRPRGQTPSVDHCISFKFSVSSSSSALCGSISSRVCMCVRIEICHVRCARVFCHERNPRLKLTCHFVFWLACLLDNLLFSLHRVFEEEQESLRARFFLSKFKEKLSVIVKWIDRLSENRLWLWEKKKFSLFFSLLWFVCYRKC